MQICAQNKKNEEEEESLGKSFADTEERQEKF